MTTGTTVPTPRQDPDLAVLDARRVEAIAASGWGASFRLVQPRNLAFWVWAVPVVWGVGYWLADNGQAAAYYGPALALGIVVFAVYGAVLWWFTQVIDRYSSQPGKLRMTAFLWGGFAATWIMALPANDALRSLYAKLFGQAWASSWSASSAVWFTEEWSKGAGLLLLIALAPHLVRTAFDGFVLGAFIGLGFQITEDISYVKAAAATGFGADQIGSTTVTFAMRLSTGLAGHILFSAIFCTGLVYLLGRPAERRRVGRGLLLVATAMAFHFVWDAESAIAHAAFGTGDAGAIATVLLIPLVPILALVAVLRVFAVTIRNERSFMPAMLAPEVARGVVTPAEVDAASGTKRDRRRYRHSGGGSRRRRHVLEAVFDLAHELGSSGGATTDRVDFARAEVRRLRARVE